MDWDAIRAYSTEAAYSVFSVPAVYTERGTGMVFEIRTVYNEAFEVRTEAGFTDYKPVAKVKLEDIPEPRENSEFEINGRTLLVDYYTKQSNNEWCLYLKEQTYGSY
jgi:hypothetical protein